MKYSRSVTNKCGFNLKHGKKNVFETSTMNVRKKFSAIDFIRNVIAVLYSHTIVNRKF